MKAFIFALLCTCIYSNVLGMETPSHQGLQFNPELIIKLPVANLALMAIEYGTPFLSWLINKNPGIHHRKDDKGRTLLHHLAIYGNAELIIYLVENVDNSNACFSEAACNADNPFHLAITYNNMEALKALCTLYRQNKALTSGVMGIDDRNSAREAPLHIAQRLQNRKAMQLLLEAGAIVDSLNMNSETPLETAISLQDKETVELLVQAGARIDTLGRFRLTALEKAKLIAEATTGPAQAHANVIVNMLETADTITARKRKIASRNHLQNGGTVRFIFDHHSYNGWPCTFQMAQAFNNNKKILGELASSSFHFYFYRDKQGRSLFHHLVINDNLEDFKRLLARAPDSITLRDDNDNTVLHTAAETNNHRFIEFLTSDYPLLATIQNNQNQTPLDIMQLNQPVVAEPIAIGLNSQESSQTEGNFPEQPTDNPPASLEDEEPEQSASELSAIPTPVTNTTQEPVTEADQEDDSVMREAHLLLMLRNFRWSSTTPFQNSNNH